MTIKQTDKAAETTKENKKLTCGIIMPISPHPDYPLDHWKDVLTIINEAIEETQFEPKLVSDDVAIGLIHDRIVTNIYNNEMVVCDVSSKNPNVMFELGLRLAFDKPTIIIKDEMTGYSFDTGVIEHITYPSSLRFGQIVKFKEELVRRIKATYKKAKDEPNYSPFLKSFGKTITPASFQQSEIPEGKYIINQLDVLFKEVRNIRMDQRHRKDLVAADNFESKVLTGKYVVFEKLMESMSKDLEIRNIESFDDKMGINALKEVFAERGYIFSTLELRELLLTYFERKEKLYGKNKLSN